MANVEKVRLLSRKLFLNSSNVNPKIFFRALKVKNAQDFIQMLLMMKDVCYNMLIILHDSCLII